MDGLINFTIKMVAAFVASMVIAFLVYELSKKYVNTPHGSSRRVREIMNTKDGGVRDYVEYGSKNHQIRLAFSQFGMRANGREQEYLWGSRLGAGAILFLLLVFGINLNPIVGLMGFIGGYLIVDIAIDNSWRTAKARIEEDLPLFLSGVATTMQVNENLPEVIELESGILDDKSELKAWIESEYLPAISTGTEIEQIRVGNQVYSVSKLLSQVLFVFSGAATTGGVKYGTAMKRIAGLSSAMLEVRNLAQSKGKGRMDALNIIAGCELMTMIIVSRVALGQELAGDFITQIGYAAAVLLMIIGYWFVNKKIQEVI